MFILTKQFIDEFKLDTVSICSRDCSRYQKDWNFARSSIGIFMALYRRKDGGLCEIYTKGDLKPGSVRVYFDGRAKTLENDKDIYELKSMFRLKAFW